MVRAMLLVLFSIALFFSTPASAGASANFCIDAYDTSSTCVGGSLQKCGTIEDDECFMLVFRSRSVPRPLFFLSPKINQ